MPAHKPSPSQPLHIGAEVMTPLGRGSVRFVYPTGPHHKITYSVSLDGRRVNRIFDERQLQLLAEPRTDRRALRRRP